jgi:hypothetical protein
VRYLLALDPGGTTGWSRWEYDVDTPLALLAHGQISGGLPGFRAWVRAVAQGWELHEVVSESFVDDGRTESPDVQALRIEGAIDMSWGGRIPVFFQRNVAKSAAPDALLKRLDVYFVGQPHACDSARHAIAYMKARDHRPTVRAIWPPRSER